MADPESLFSLEVVVETVENVVVACRTPAIAFRLLDFPTLVIRAEENGRARDSTTPSYHKLHSGKSCLFKVNKNMLYTRLQSTPLYVMLVDIGAENTKLLASTTISLSNCFENVWQSIERNGLDVPAVHGNKGVFELYNLMGTPVAIVKLSYRIFSLGGTINGHVNTSETLIKSTYCKPKFSRQNQKSTIDENLLLQNSLQKRENTLSDFQCEVGTQADFNNEERPMESFNMESRPLKCTHDKATVNISKPPPLYYNSQSSFMDSFSQVNTKSLGFTQERSLVEKTNDAVNSCREATPRECYQTVSVQTDETEMLDYASKLHDERAKRSDLPVVNALLNELSLVKQNWMGAQLEHHRNEAQPVAVNHKHKDLPMVDISQPDAKSSCALKNKINPSSKRKVRPKQYVKLPGKGVLVSRNPIKIKKSLLKYGTTKTQKLRENLNKKMAGCINISSSNAEGKRAPTQNNGEEGNVVAIKDKESKEVACQVEMTSSGAPQVEMTSSGAPQVEMTSSGAPQVEMTSSGAPQVEMTSSGAPQVEMTSSGAPQVEMTSSGAPQVEMTSSGAPQVEMTSSGAPQVEMTSSGAPQVEMTSSGAPQVEMTSSGAPQVEMTSSGAPQVEMTSSGAPQVEMTSSGAPQVEMTSSGAPQVEMTSSGAPQVEMTSSGAHQNKQEIELGIQCISRKRQKEKLSFSDEDNRNMFVGDSKDIQEDPNKELALTIPKSRQEIFLPSDVELTSHSKSCASQELVSIKQGYSNFTAPIRKNSRYNSDKHSSVSEEGKSSSIDSESSKKNSLLGKTYSHTKCPSKSSSSSFEHNYSHDNFDSYVSDPITEISASDKLNIGISTVETNEQSD